jgi:hypothetical protein
MIGPVDFFDVAESLIRRFVVALADRISEVMPLDGYAGGTVLGLHEPL